MNGDISTPWGKSQTNETIVRGVKHVTCSGHGGIMIAKGYAAKNLTAAARKMGESYGGYLCYEEDCAYAIPEYELLKKFPALVVTLYPRSDKSLLERMVSLRGTLSRWNPEYLIEIGEVPSEKEYGMWKADKLQDEMRARKDPNLIISAIGVGDDMVKVWTADDKQHMVVGKSYENRRTPNLLSDCVIISAQIIAEIYSHSGADVDTLRYLKEYLSQSGDVEEGEYISTEECKLNNKHLNDCDKDGYCNFCGEQ